MVIEGISALLGMQALDAVELIKPASNEQNVAQTPAVTPIQDQGDKITISKDAQVAFQQLQLMSQRESEDVGATEESNSEPGINILGQTSEQEETQT